MREYLHDLNEISWTTRTEISGAIEALLKRHGKQAGSEPMRAMFLATLDSMADLIQSIIIYCYLFDKDEIYS